MGDSPNPDDLELVSDEQHVELRGPMMDRLGMLLTAYHRGMVVARTDGEQELLTEIAGLLGPPSSVQE